MATGVASSFTTVGRGRGRGRGLAGALKKPGLTLNKETGGDEGKPKETPLSDIIKELHAESVESTTREVKRRATLSDTGNNQDVIDRVVTLAFERALEDVDSTQFILALVEKLWMEEFSGGVSSKRPILQTAQNLYKSRENLKSYSESKFRGLCCLLCGVYGKLRIPAGSPPKDMPLKPLIGPVYNILNELLESDSVDSTLCFHQELTNTSFSKLLENGEPVCATQITCLGFAFFQKTSLVQSNPVNSSPC